MDKAVARSHADLATSNEPNVRYLVFGENPRDAQKIESQQDPKKLNPESQKSKPAAT
jgi:hypothetical protein